MQAHRVAGRQVQLHVKTGSNISEYPSATQSSGMEPSLFWLARCRSRQNFVASSPCINRLAPSLDRTSLALPNLSRNICHFAVSTVINMGLVPWSLGLLDGIARLVCHVVRHAMFATARKLSVTVHIKCMLRKPLRVSDGRLSGLARVARRIIVFNRQAIRELA